MLEADTLENSLCISKIAKKLDIKKKSKKCHFFKKKLTIFGIFLKNVTILAIC